MAQAELPRKELRATVRVYDGKNEQNALRSGLSAGRRAQYIYIYERRKKC